MQVLLIAVVVAVLVTEDLAFSIWDRFDAGWVVAGALLPQLLIAILVDVRCRYVIGQLDQPEGGSGRCGGVGGVRLIDQAERAAGRARVLSVGVHLVAVLLLGWASLVRQWLGDLVLIDELIVISPVLMVFLAGWWSLYPIEHRVREVILIRRLDEGRPIHKPLSRSQHLLMMVRLNLLLVLVPVLMIVAWADAVQLVVGHMDLEPERAMNLETVLSFAGVGLVLMLMPLAMRFLWKTHALPEGVLRDRIERVCELQKVRVRNVLIWHTAGTMFNGAVMGLISQVRYILLTDALLEGLSAEQVEAVMAHEVAHVKHRHMIWLGAAVLGAVGASSVVISMISHHLLGLDLNSDTAAVVVTVLSMVFGLGVFSLVSQRFEWQADAFAAAHLTQIQDMDQHDNQDDDQDDVNGQVDAESRITAQAAWIMSSALGAVADRSGVARDRFSWRHGSIANRQSRLDKLVNAALGALPIDRKVRIIKLIVAIVLILVVSGMVWMQGEG